MSSDSTDCGSSVVHPATNIDKSSTYEIHDAKFMLHHVANVLLYFQRFPTIRGSSMQHERNKARFNKPRRA
jgi:hypothetical protein